MKNKYWFRPKKYGYGVYPISWEGWLATLILLGFLLLLAHANDLFIESINTEKDSIIFVAEAIVCAFLFVYFFKGRTDGDIKWRWGDK